MIDFDFDSFEDGDWTTFAWDTIEYPEEDVTIEDVHYRIDLDKEDLKKGRQVHTQDERFNDVKSDNLDISDPKDYLYNIYSIKQFVEISPQSEITDVRIIGQYLKAIYEHCEFDPNGVKDGSLIDKFERHGLLVENEEERRNNFPVETDEIFDN